MQVVDEEHPEQPGGQTKEKVEVDPVETEREFELVHRLLESRE